MFMHRCIDVSPPGATVGAASSCWPASSVALPAGGSLSCPNSQIAGCALRSTTLMLTWIDTNYLYQDMHDIPCRSSTSSWSSFGGEECTLSVSCRGNQWTYDLYMQTEQLIVIELSKMTLIYMCMHRHIDMYYIYTYIYLYIYLFTYVCMYVCVYIYVFIHKIDEPPLHDIQSVWWHLSPAHPCATPATPQADPWNVACQLANVL